jgi:hypothetical protein
MAEFFSSLVNFFLPAPSARLSRAARHVASAARFALVVDEAAVRDEEAVALDAPPEEGPAAVAGAHAVVEVVGLGLAAAYRTDPETARAKFTCFFSLGFRTVNPLNSVLLGAYY